MMLMLAVAPLCALSMQVDRAEVLRIVDGDTVELRLSLGFDLELRDSARLWGIDAPERYEADGPAATEYLRSMIPPGTQVYVERVGDGRDKYGRLLLRIFDQDCRDINRAMIDAGHAVEYLR